MSILLILYAYISLRIGIYGILRSHNSTSTISFIKAIFMGFLYMNFPSKKSNHKDKENGHTSLNAMRNKICRFLPRILKDIAKRNFVEQRICKSLMFDGDCAVAINEYILHVVSVFDVNAYCLIYTLALIDKICLTKKHVLSNQNIHKTFFVALMVTLKFLLDVFHYSSDYSYASGIHIKELNVLERELLEMIDYKVSIEDCIFEQYLSSIKLL